MIIETETGFIAECASAKSFNEAMDRPWRHKERWKEMGVKAFQKAEPFYTVNAEEKLFNLITID